MKGKLYALSRFARDEHGYVKVPITQNMKFIATSKAIDLGLLNNSIRGGRGNMVGYLGQMAVEQAISGMRREDTYDYDLVCDGFRFEVKTKDRTVNPQPSYECSVASANDSQKADYYIFVSVYRHCSSYEMAYILGYITTAEYFHKAKFMCEGENDPSNNFDVKADCWNLPIKGLIPFA
jgi:hypothetical protein